jgi:hypothetical protein
VETTSLTFNDQFRFQRDGRFLCIIIVNTLKMNALSLSRMLAASVLARPHRIKLTLLRPAAGCHGLGPAWRA